MNIVSRFFPVLLCFFLIALCVSTGCFALSEKKPLSITFFNVGQGDSCLLQYNGKTMLVDAGPYEAGPVIADWLKSRNISKIDIIVSTHPHSDHIGGIPYLLKRFTIGTLIDSGDPHTTPTYERLLKTIENENIPYKTVRAGDLLDLDPALSIEVKNPNEPLGDDINDNSIVLRISDGERTILLMGDAGITPENRIRSEGVDMNADIIKIGHHGSRHSSGKKFIQEVSPEIAVISLARDNEYGYPHRDPIRYLNEGNAQILRTDEIGTTTIKTSTEGFSIVSEDEIIDMSYCSCSAIREFCKKSAGEKNPCCTFCEA